jgi:hypothetical protein
VTRGWLRTVPRRGKASRPDRLLVAFGLSSVLAGCLPVPLPSTVEAARSPTARTSEAAPASQLPRPLAPGEKVVIIAAEPEDSFAEGVREQVAERAPTIPQLAEDDFRRALFPWFQSGWPSERPEAFERAMREQAVRRRIAELDLRYLVEVRGDTEENASFTSGAPYPGAMGWGRPQTHLAAKVWDLKEGRAFDDAAVETSGVEFLFWAVYGVYLFSMTESKATAEVADRLILFFEGKPPPPEITASGQ